MRSCVVKRVVVALKDPNPKTSGKSIKKLKAHGIEVLVGVLKEEAKDLNKAFLKAQIQKRPYVIAKIAQSLDGEIARNVGQRTQITGAASQTYVQELRQGVDAILVGRNTIAVDNPKLNVRNSKKFQPKRIVLDSNLKLSPQSQIFKCHGGRVILCCTLAKQHKKVISFEKLGATVFCFPKAKKLALKIVLKKIFDVGIHSLLVEGGAEVFTSFLKSNLVDEWHFLISPKILGKKGVNAFKNSHDFSYKLFDLQKIKQDTLLKFRR